MGLEKCKTCPAHNNVIAERHLKYFDRLLEGPRFFPLSTLLAVKKHIQTDRNSNVSPDIAGHVFGRIYIGRTEKSTWRTRLYDIFRTFFF